MMNPQTSITNIKTKLFDTIEVATCAQEALEILKDSSKNTLPKLILLDLNSLL